MRLSLSALRKVILERLYATIDHDSFDDNNIHASFDISGISDLESLKKLNFSNIIWDPKDEKYADLLEPGEYNIDDWIADISSMIYIDTNNDVAKGDSKISEDDIKKLNISEPDEFVHVFNFELRTHKAIYGVDFEWAVCVFKNIPYAIFKKERQFTFNNETETLVLFMKFDMSKIRMYFAKVFNKPEDIRKNIPSLIVSKLADAMNVNEDSIPLNHEF